MWTSCAELRRDAESKNAALQWGVTLNRTLGWFRRLGQDYMLTQARDMWVCPHSYKGEVHRVQNVYTFKKP